MDHDIAAIRQAMDRDDVVHIPAFLSRDEIADAEAVFDWTEANPGPGPTAAPQVAGLHKSLSAGDHFRHAVFPLLA